MGRSALAASFLIALFAVGPAAAAPASDAQVKAALVRAIAAVAHQKGTTLQASLKGVRVSLGAASPVSAAAKSAKTFALQGVAKASLAASEEIAADKDSTRMQYAGATSQTALATKNLTAAGKLLDKAATLLGVKPTLR